jgi:hypothetical protein
MKNKLLITLSVLISMLSCQNNSMRYDSKTESIVSNIGFRRLYFTNNDNMETYFVKKKTGVGKITELRLKKLDTNLIICKRLGGAGQHLAQIPFDANSNWTVSNVTNGDAAEFSIDFYIDENEVFIQKVDPY